MRENGLTPKTVLSELKRRQTADKTYRNGRILCSMCTSPHPVAKKAYLQYFESNLGDSGLFPASAQIEKEVVRDLGALLHCPQAAGFIVSGGTEANLLALTAAKNMSQTDKPVIVLPQSAHFSFNKICKLLNITPIYAPLNSQYQVDTQKIEPLITKNTIALVGTVGTAEFGAVDSICELSEIASTHHLPLHVDAAFGGLVVPFLEDPKPKFDFELESVTSITVDPHKMGFAAIPAGGILFRNTVFLEKLKTPTPYLSDSCHYTFVGTRSGASAASAWAVFNVLGRGTYRKIVASCMGNTRFLAKKLVDGGFRLMAQPTLNVVAFRSERTAELAKKLWKMGWYVSYNSRYDCIRIVVMPHNKRVHLQAFLADLATQKL